MLSLLGQVYLTHLGPWLDLEHEVPCGLNPNWGMRAATVVTYLYKPFPYKLITSSKTTQSTLIQHEV